MKRIKTGILLQKNDNNVAVPILFELFSYYKEVGGRLKANSAAYFKTLAKQCNEIAGCYGFGFQTA